MRATTEPAATATTSSVPACTSVAARVRAPARTLTAVRAMAPVAGMPPNSGETTFASPCPTSSRSGSCAEASAMPSATFAERRLSIAARRATASAAGRYVPSRSSSRVGSDGSGSASGSAPMRATGQCSSSASTVAAATAASEPGKRGEWRDVTSITTATTPTSVSVRSESASVALTARTATAAAFSPAGFATPSAPGTCCRKMIAAMPTAKPSITGHGMNARNRPNRSTPDTSTIRPARMPIAATAPAPSCATSGTSTTVIAPVGPETWKFEPPNTPAIRPATIAVVSPAAAPRPVVMPNARASGSATTATVTPAIASSRQPARNPA